jgi:hypothetical protein
MHYFDGDLLYYSELNFEILTGIDLCLQNFEMLTGIDMCVQNFEILTGNRQNINSSKGWVLSYSLVPKSQVEITAEYIYGVFQS